MEREYKWSVADAAEFQRIVESGQIAPLVQSHETFEMNATYYDTYDGQLARARAGLRLRRENGEGVVCLKLSPQAEEGGALMSREEYECYAPDIRSGLLNLPAVGAPQEFCDMVLKSDLLELGRTDYIREAYLLRYEGSVCEMVYDCGTISHRGRSMPISEIELELKEGGMEGFHALAQLLHDTFSLVPERRSKLMRMLHL